MRQVRPTLKTIRRLPRDSFADTTVYDQVAQLQTASREAREQILSGLRLYRLEHTLISDARSYFDSGVLPDQHRAATLARSTKHGKTQPVYEVRSHTGAGWRGGVIKDYLGDPWLAHADPHDEFHESAPKIFSDRGRYYPSGIDFKVREHEEAGALRKTEDISCLTQMLQALSEAVHSSPSRHDAVIEISDGKSFGISFEVELSDTATDVSFAHEALSEVSVSMAIDISDHELRDRVLRLYLPFLQPDPALREQVYGMDRSTMLVSLMMTQAQLAQALVTTSTGDEPRPAVIPEPTLQHFFERKKLAGAFVYGEALKALCGAWIVPSKEGDLAEHLPVCEQCETVEPVAQSLLDLARRE